MSPGVLAGAWKGHKLDWDFPSQGWHRHSCVSKEGLGSLPSARGNGKP